MVFCHRRKHVHFDVGSVRNHTPHYFVCGHFKRNVKHHTATPRDVIREIQRERRFTSACFCCQYCKASRRNTVKVFVKHLKPSLNRFALDVTQRVNRIFNRVFYSKQRFSTGVCFCFQCNLQFVQSSVFTLVKASGCKSARLGAFAARPQPFQFANILRRFKAGNGKLILHNVKQIFVRLFVVYPRFNRRKVHADVLQVQRLRGQEYVSCLAAGKVFCFKFIKDIVMRCRLSEQRVNDF